LSAHIKVSTTLHEQNTREGERERERERETRERERDEENG